MRIAAGEQDYQAFQDYLERCGRCHFAQSPLWAGVKIGWDYRLVLAEGPGGEITGGAGILIRRLPVFGNLMYCPRGPVCGSGDLDAMEQITQGVRALMREHRAFALRAEPDVPCDDPLWQGNMQRLGWRFRPIRDSRDTVQPRSVFRLNLAGRTEEDILSGFHKKLRYNIRLAQRHGVTVTEGARRDLDAFAALMSVTAARDGFTARDPVYYYRLWDALGEQRVCLLLAHYEDELVAGGLFVHMGGKTWYLYGASSNEHRNMMPCPLLQWEAIRRALARGDSIFDLRGFLEITDETDPRGGLYRFKRQFGGDLVRLVGEAYLTDAPLKYALYRRAERLYRVMAPRLEKLAKKV